ncbi:hypothetical protein BDW67DRAFT_189252 [Aspergillus spinulosporus]
MEVISANIPPNWHQALKQLYHVPSKQKVTVQTTTTEITEKEPRKLWQNPHTYAIQALHSPWHRMMLRLQSSLFHASIDFFRHEMAYEYLIVPLTTGSISSPMGLGSDSQPVSIEMSSGSEKTTSTYLADSQQFLLEYALRLQNVPRGVYYAGTSCRGEDPDATHLNQFFHVECELVGGLNVTIVKNPLNDNKPSQPQCSSDSLVWLCVDSVSKIEDLDGFLGAGIT